MYIQGLFRNEKESLLPNDCHCGGTNCTGYDPNILVLTQKSCVIDYCLNDIKFVHNGC